MINDNERILDPTDRVKLEQRCNETILSQTFSPNEGDVYCNATFDDTGCWNITMAGELAFSQLGTTSGDAFRNCSNNGTWLMADFINVFNRTDDMFQYREPIQHYIFVSGGWVSLVLLIIAFGIFTRYRQLQCKRIALHKQLFLSYILQNACWLGYYATRRQEFILLENPIWCQIIHVVALYFLETNYAWMFCEGFFLHTQIVVPFTNDTTLLRICHVIGWVVPFVVTLIYAILRLVTPAFTERCWSVDGGPLLDWIFFGPIIFFVVVNFLVLINIMRILLSKLRARRSSTDMNQTKSALKAALILVPLLGVQYLLVPVSLPPTHPAYMFFTILSAYLSAYQGANVAILLCFINKEVIELFKRRYSQMRDTYLPRSTSRSGSTSHTLGWFSSFKVSHNKSSKKEEEFTQVALNQNNTNRNGHVV